MNPGIYFVIAAIFAVVAACIASGKNRNPLGWAVVGGLFGLIGVLIIAVASPVARLDDTM